MAESRLAIPQSEAIRKLLDLNSSHISKLGLDWLTREGARSAENYYQSSVVIFSNEISLIVVIGSEAIPLKDAEAMGMPHCVMNVLNFCFDEGIEYVRFDPDAPIIFGLPVYGCHT
jgi:hypothetical protein